MSSIAPEIPELAGEARVAADYRGGHLQIIASAGAGKTEVVSQRVAGLLAEGEDPRSIVAFTFTERAASSLKARIERRAIALAGPEILDRLGGMYVGTIHAYCFRLLQQHVTEYEIFDVLDDHRLTAFLSREAYALGIADLDTRLYRAIKRFIESAQVVENELLPVRRLRQPFRAVYEEYVAMLRRYRLLTYGQFISAAVEALGRPEVATAVHTDLRHLIVDEYQDVNPAQEALISRLIAAGADLCVVGDDQQCIFQWRGSTVENIITFADRYPDAARFRIEINRRSRPQIIATADAFATSISKRLDKQMQPYRASATVGDEVTCWRAPTRADEAQEIARGIRRAHDQHGYRWSDIAVLCRTKSSFPDLLAALDAAGVPVQPGGRTGLFDKPEAELFGQTMCWLVGYDWRTSAYDWHAQPVELRELAAGYRDVFGLDDIRSRRLRRCLRHWQTAVDDESGPANLVGSFLTLVRILGAQTWDLEEPLAISQLGTLARCSHVLADYEAASRRSRPDPNHPGQQRGARDRGRRYYEWLARYVQNWARGAYEDFEGEEHVDVDAVDLLTIHKAKGLEWPIVFCCALADGRFPSSRNGTERDWLVPRRRFAAERYEGTDDDERRLFYVAMTRARDHLSLSCSAAVVRQSCRPSPYLLEVCGGEEELSGSPADAPPPEKGRGNDADALEVTFSDLSAYSECPFAYRLRRLIGLAPPLATEIGYGRAVHHVLRHIAEEVRASDTLPDAAELDALFDRHFYLPAANRPAHRQLKAQARRLVDRYVDDWGDELRGVWAVERPFSLHLGDAVVAGRADVIMDDSRDGSERLSIVDYKTAADNHGRHEFQLQVYADAGRREGLDVRRAFIHDLRGAQRHDVAVGVRDITQAHQATRRLVDGLRNGDFGAQPGEVCARCDVSAACRFGPEKP